jgi:methyl-CpG-binding domain protein 4
MEDGRWKMEDHAVSTPYADDMNMPPRESIKAARKLWLEAKEGSDLVQVEHLYRHALRTNKLEKEAERRRCNGEDQNDAETGTESARGSKEARNKRKRKRGLSTYLTPSESKKACERLALLLCQSDRLSKAKSLLSRMGYVCRLSGAVLDYEIPQPQPISILSNIGCSGGEGLTSNTGASPCCILDNFMSQIDVDHLADVFKSPTADYWTSHDYAVEPPSPYFSYIIPLDSPSRKNNSTSNNESSTLAMSNFGFLGGLIEKIYQNKSLRTKFPKLKNATRVEMWAHNRPHASAHQLHFDSDDEGRGGIRNPIISTILYITAGCGGPSLVTNQKLGDEHLASKGWLSYPEDKRLIAFDGRYLHGVIPGKGVQIGRRVTLMFAFWPDIRTREGDGPGSARPFPLEGREWATKLVENKKSEDLCKESSSENEIREGTPVFIDRVYETLSSKRWSKSKGLPDYDSVFQGF